MILPCQQPIFYLHVNHHMQVYFPVDIVSEVIGFGYGHLRSAGPPFHPVLLGVTFLVFAIAEFTPGDPVMIMLGTRAP